MATIIFINYSDLYSEDSINHDRINAQFPGNSGPTGSWKSVYNSSNYATEEEWAATYNTYAIGSVRPNQLTVSAPTGAGPSSRTTKAPTTTGSYASSTDTSVVTVTTTPSVNVYKPPTTPGTKDGTLTTKDIGKWMIIKGTTGREDPIILELPVDSKWPVTGCISGTLGTTTPLIIRPVDGVIINTLEGYTPSLELKGAVFTLYYRGYNTWDMWGSLGSLEE